MILKIGAELRKWLIANSSTEKCCWITVDMKPCEDAILYLDAFEVGQEIIRCPAYCNFKSFHTLYQSMRIVTIPITKRVPYIFSAGLLTLVENIRNNKMSGKWNADVIL